MIDGTIIIAWCIAVAGVAYNWRMMTLHLCPAGRLQSRRIVRGLLPLYRRDNFTAEGWRYRNRAFLFALGWITFGLLWGVIKSRAHSA
jgi:hypothetical protein